MALFVGRLPADATSRDLESVFSKYGRISRCDIKKGFGFVQFEDRRDAEEAVAEADGKRILGSPIVVEWAKNGGQKPTSTQCFRCGKEGHWARDCRSSGSYGNERERRRSRSPGRDRDRRDYGRRDDYDRRDDRRERDDRRGGERDRSHFYDSPGRSYRPSRGGGGGPSRHERSPASQRDRGQPRRESEQERSGAPEATSPSDWDNRDSKGWE